MQSPRVARLALLWLVAIGWPCGLSHAQVDAARDEARSRFQRGVEAARAGDWDEARAEFGRSHALVPSAVTLLNLAGSQVNCGRLVEGHATYRLLLKRPGEARAHLSDIERVVRELEARLPTLRFVPSEPLPALRVALDGKELPSGDGSAGVHLDPGQHHVELARAGDQPVRHDFSIAEGQTLVLDLAALCPDCASERAASPRTSEQAQAPHKSAAVDEVAVERAPAPRLRTLALTSFALAGAGLLALAVTGPLALKENRQLAAGCGEGRQCNAAEVRRADRLAVGADVSLGVALGFAVVGTVAWFVGGKRPEAKHALRVSPTATRSQVGLTGQVSF
jgi:hypothetical protein